MVAFMALYVEKCFVGLELRALHCKEMSEF